MFRYSDVVYAWSSGRIHACPVRIAPFGRCGPLYLFDILMITVARAMMYSSSFVSSSSSVGGGGGTWKFHREWVVACEARLNRVLQL